MPFALFSGDRQVSAAFHTEAEVWTHAEKAGALTQVPVQEEDAQIERVLAPGYSIRPVTGP